MPNPPKPANDVSSIEEVRAEIEAEVKRHARRMAELTARLVSDQAANDERLPSVDKDRSIVVDMLQSKTVQAPKRERMGRPLITDHPFPRRLEALDTNVDAWAKAHAIASKTVRSWYQVAGGRRIPRAIAEQIEREMGVDENGIPHVPATLAIWRNGIR